MPGRITPEGAVGLQAPEQVDVDCEWPLEKSDAAPPHYNTSAVGLQRRGTGGLSNFDGPNTDAHTTTKKRNRRPMSSISDAIHATPTAANFTLGTRIDLVSLGQQVVGRLIEFLIFSVGLTCHGRNRILSNAKAVVELKVGCFHSALSCRNRIH